MSLTYASIIPLIGGFPIGAELATGQTPNKIYSYDGFLGNDQLYLDYLSQKGKNVPYEIITDTTQPQKYDFVVVTAPCAGLSMLSRNKTSAVDNGRCQKNEWMLQSTRDAIRLFEPEVIVGENAPGLYTKMGKHVADQLRDIALDAGYSVTFLKTDTALHGIPQHRVRTFYFLWRNKTAPILNFSDVPTPPLHEFFAKSASKETTLIEPKVLNCPFYRFLKHKNIALNDHQGYTSLQIIQREALEEACLEYYINDNKIYGKLKGMFDKLSRGGNVWDASPSRSMSSFNALTNRNKAALHPHFDRSLNFYEALKIMGLPEDFPIPHKLNMFPKITQNVPTCTAKSMVEQVMKYLNNELVISSSDVIYQNRIRGGAIEFKSNSHRKINTF